MSGVGLEVILFRFFCSEENQEAFESWNRHDEQQDNFCEIEGILILLCCSSNIINMHQAVGRQRLIFTKRYS